MTFSSSASNKIYAGIYEKVLEITQESKSSGFMKSGKMPG